MANPVIRIKRSSVEGKIPTPDQVPLGEVALNTFDGKFYASKNVGIGTTVFAINPWTVGTGTNTYNTYFTAGNVGIASTLPSAILDVVGDAKFTGIITATNFVGDGSNLTGIVTSITAGTGISINQSTGNVTISASGGGSQTLDQTLALGNISAIGMSVGVVTASSFVKSGGVSSEFLKADGSVDSNTYATETYVGLATVGLASVDYVDTQVGLSTIGLASEAFVGLSTAGLASETYVGLATAGLLTSTGDGSNLTNIVTQITAGSGISVDQNTGNVTITATGGGGGGSQWVTTDVGIHTLSNVGIGTTNPTSLLTVAGNTLITGITTIGGNVSLNGNITLGDNTSDNISVNGEFVTNLIPNTTNSYDLGSSTQKWRDLWVSGSLNSTTIELGNASDTTLSRSAAGTVQIEGVTIATASNTLTLSGKTMTAAAETLYAFGNTGTSATLALSNGSFVTATLTGNCTFAFDMTGVPSGAFSFSLVLTNDATPSRTITWPASVKWPNGTVPVRTETADKTDVYTFFTYDSGTTWWGNLSLYNFS